MLSIYCKHQLQASQRTEWNIVLFRFVLNGCDVILSCVLALYGADKTKRQKLNGILFCSITCTWSRGRTLPSSEGIFFVFRSCFCTSSVLFSQLDSSGSKRTVQHSSSAALLFWCSRLSGVATYCSSFPCWGSGQWKEEESRVRFQLCGEFVKQTQLCDVCDDAMREELLP